MLTLLRNATLYAPEPRGACHLLVGGERVLWIGASLDALPSALDADEIDLAGARVIPGLIDAHVHLTGGGGESGPQSRVPAPFLSRYTLGGVTSVVGVLGTDDVTRSTGELVVTARGLVAEGLSAWCHTGGYHLPPVTLTGSVRGDIVHIDRIIGVGEVAISDHRSSQPTREELLRLGADAHVAGLMTGKAGIVHLHVGDGARGVSIVRELVAGSELPPRTWQPTHINRRRALFDAAMTLARDVGCTVDITDFPVAADEDAWSAADALERWWAHGAPPERVTVSSDGGGCLPEFDADGRVVRMGVGDSRALSATVQELVRRGHALERVLPPFTSTVAAYLRLPGKGRVVAGGDADLVVLDAAGAVRDVMARGVWHVRGGALRRRGTFE
ncbi:MAG: beta-aspartyl-peptidase [Gemmatimonadaceae bacterium]|nr:beta-aspartyl-peptidase [Gemmatimonadaceae bacterium]